MAGLSSFEKKLVDRIRQSEAFQAYQDSFQQVTGLPLRLVMADEDWCLNPDKSKLSPFCKLLNKAHTTHSSCREINNKITRIAGVKGTTTQTCFAGLATTAVPVRHNEKTIGFLKTGQVFNEAPSPEDFDKLVKKFRAMGFTPAQIERLRDSYLETQTVLPRRYAHMVVLLDIFAEQITRQAEQLAITLEGSIPEPVAKALRHIHQNFDKPLNLEDTALHAGLSRAHFSRQFKAATGISFTEYINRTRVFRARERLLKPAERISDIAFNTGFQSLSQFNRTFHKYTGQSPSEYRRGKLQQGA